MNSNKFMLTSCSPDNVLNTGIISVPVSLISNHSTKTTTLDNISINVKPKLNDVDYNSLSSICDDTNLNRNNQPIYILQPQNRYTTFYRLYTSRLDKPRLRPHSAPKKSLSCQPSPNISQRHLLNNHPNSLLTSPLAERKSQNSMNFTESSDYSTTYQNDAPSCSMNDSNKHIRSPEKSLSVKLKHQFFQRFWKHSSKFNRTTRSENNSPSLSPLGHRNPALSKYRYSPTCGVWNSTISPTNVKLIDAYLMKGPSGFGLTLIGVITFIPSGLLDFGIVTNSFNGQNGFFQRLLQIQSVSDDLIIYANDFMQSYTKQQSIRQGDILLAAGGHRLAGCTPEYAVQLLSRIPYGGVIHITLLRGLSIPMNQSVNENVNDAKYQSHEARSSSLCSSVNSSIELSPNKTNSDSDVQNRQRFSQSYLNSFCSKCRDSIRTVNLNKSENDYGFTYVYTSYGCLINQVITMKESSENIKPKLFSGDLIVKIGNFEVAKLTKSQFSQLLSVYLKEKSIQLTLIQVCSNCLKQINYRDAGSNVNETENKDDSKEDPLNPELDNSLNFDTKATDRVEMISFLRTVLNPNCYPKKSSNHNLEVKNETGEKYISVNPTTTDNYNNHTTTSELSQTPSPWLPGLHYIIPGIGTSGPCGTPDYIPISELLNKSKTNVFQNSNSSNVISVQSDHHQQQQNDSLKQNQCEVNDQQTNLYYKNDNNPLHNRGIESSLTSSVLSTAHMGSLHDRILNPLNGNKAHTTPTENDVRIRYIPNEGKLKFVQENIEQNLPSIIPMNVNLQSRELNQNHLDGDLLVAIENQSVLNRKPNEIEELIQLAAQKNKGFVTLTVRKSNNTGKSESTKLTVDDPINNFHNSKIINVKLVKKKDEGFGFVIVTSLNNQKASEIGRIIPESPADKCGQLEVGQRILAINGYWLTGINHMDIVNLIRQSQQELILTVEKTDYHPSENSNIGCTDQLDTNQISSSSNTLSIYLPNSSKCLHSFNDSKTSEISNEKLTPNLNLNDTSTQRLYSVTLQRGPNGFGFSVRSGCNSNTSSLIVYRITENGSAFQQGQMKTGDEILEINGISTLTMTHQQAVDMIRSSGSTIRILLQHFNEADQNENSF
ncbi:unnamed protein product [Heterobilharzia americana]|nr:unnamed protein product [Heterobilharzia americana]